MRTCLLALAIVGGSSGAAFATDFTVTPPANGATCPDRADGYYASLGVSPCYYQPVGAFTDTYRFTVADATVPYTFDVSGLSWHTVVQSGRAHPSYTIDMVIASASVVDLASGSVVAQLTNTPYWAFRACSTPGGYPCSGHQSDHWSGTFTLPPGQYAFTVTGNEGGNRVFAYPWSIQVPVAPVQPPLAGVVLTGTVTCDASSVCTMTPADPTAVKSVSLDFAAKQIVLVPSVDPAYSGAITTGPVLVSVDSTGTVFTLAGAGSITGANSATLQAVFIFTLTVNPSTGAVTPGNWIVALS